VKYALSEGKAWAREKMVGQWTTMMTPFTAQDELDEAGLAANIEHVLRLGTKGMGFSWNMGEFWSLARSERLRLMEIVPTLVRNRALTAFQVTDTSVKEVEEQVLDFVRRVAEQVDIGIAFYNSPQFGITLSARALARMADLTNLIAIKEASFNPQISIDTHLLAGSKAVVSAPDEEIFFFEPFYGFHQQVMFANTSDWRFDTLDNHDYVTFIDRATRGDLEEARRLYAKIWPIKNLSRRWWGRIAARTGGALPVQMVKYWGELMGMKGGHVRPPVVPLTAEERTELRRDLAELRPLRPAESGG
jgi:4-hydroxy-tetrahydrodipicolinate synthase